KYQAGVNLNIFNKDRRISIVAQSNNINIQNFSSQDLVGISGSGGQGNRGGGGRGGQSGGGNTSNFLVGQQNGISTTHAAGLNYSDKWGKKIDVTGSYFFNRSNNTANQFSFRNYVLPADSGQTYQQNSLSSSTNYNQRVNLRLNYRIDSSNSLLIRPSFSWQQNNGISSLSAQTNHLNEILNQTNNAFYSRLTGYNFSNEALFRHRFSKPRRTISFNLTTGYNLHKGESNLRAENNFYDSSVDADTINQNSSLNKNGWNMVGNATYTEPLGKQSMLQLNYIISLQRNNSNKETFNFSEETGRYSLLDTALTNRFESRYFSQQVGTSYRYQTQKINLSVGANYQWAQMKNDQLLPRPFDLTRSFYNVLPTAVLRYKFSDKQNLNITYRASTNQPSVNQLQNVINNANPIQLSTGNPDLKQTYQHNLSFRYNVANTEKSRTSFASLSGSYANDYVVNSVYIAERDSVLNGGIDLKKGSQLSRPVNADGYWTLRSFATYGVPIKLLKSNLNFNASLNYTHSPGFINNQLNYSDAQTLGLGVILSSNISDKLDFTLSSTSSLNRSQNTLQSKLNNRYFNQNSRLSLNWIFWKGFVYQTSLNHQINTGLSSGYNQSFLLWNMSIGKKFLKNQQGELKLSVYDLLKQNNSIQRNINVAYIEDVQTQVLQRYFMLTFTYNLRNFKK
ncbi:MAG: outer membrane beta-barrel protein, partial [Bacteroidota bacterium]